MPYYFFALSYTRHIIVLVYITYYYMDGTGSIIVWHALHKAERSHDNLGLLRERDPDAVFTRPYVVVIQSEVARQGDSEELPGLQRATRNNHNVQGRGAQGTQGGFSASIHL